ncbi:unnamed protein product, partial [Heterobilharzia americana]
IQSFKLTQSKPHSILIPEIIPKMKKMHNPPKSTYTEPLEISLLLMTKEKNHQEVKKLKIQSDRLRSRCTEVIHNNTNSIQQQNDLHSDDN